MNSPSRSYRRSKRFLAVVLILGLLLPFSTAQAVLTVTRTLAQTSTDFGEGNFGLTGLAQGGGVQLVPLGVLKRWFTSNKNLCYTLSDMGTASFTTSLAGVERTFLYAVGGGSRTGGTPVVYRNGVCRAEVLDQSGQTTDWTVDAQVMPETRASTAVVAVPLADGRGKLFVFGGRLNADDTQKNTIYSAIINFDGTLGAWTTLTLALPTPRERLTATVYTNDQGTDTRADDKSFIYVIGGYQRPFLSLAYRDVLRADVDLLGNISGFVPQAPVPVPMPAGSSGCENDVGIHDTDATTYNVTTSNGNFQMLLVVGGMIELGSASICSPTTAPTARVFQALIDSTTGTITWQDAPDQQYTLPEPAQQTQVMGINNKIYVIAGMVGSGANPAPSKKVFSTYVKDDLNINTFTLGNFISSDTALTDAQARAAHGLELVTVNTRPIAYMYGGTFTSNDYRNDVLFGYVGTDDDLVQGAGYPSAGIYQSPSYDLRGMATLVNLQWTARISNTTTQTDIRMEYRLAASLDTLRGAPWNLADGDTGTARFSIQGQNTGMGTAGITGRYMQFRAFLTTNETENPNATPLLSLVKATITIDGHPSLFVESASFPTIMRGGTNSPTVTIKNTRPTGSTSTETILDADISGPGTFFVDLFVFPPGAAVVFPPRNPDGSYDLTNSAAYAEINKASMPADGTLSIPPNLWEDSCSPNSSNCPPANWEFIFNRSGTWKALLLIDSGNNIEEADTITGAWEVDNFLQITVVSSVQGGNLLLPLMLKDSLMPATPPARSDH